MCYVHLRDTCEECDSFERLHGRPPDFIELSYGLPKEVIYDENGESTKEANRYQNKRYGIKEKTPIKIFGIKIGEIG